jgi:hypothetical protein
MPTIKIDGIDYEATQEVINRCSKLDTQVEDLTKKLSTAEAERDANKSRADKAETELKAMPQKMIEALAGRRALESQATPILAKDTKFDSMTDDQIRTAVIAARLPEVKLDGKDATYIATMYTAALAVKPSVDPKSVNNTLLGGSSNGIKNDSGSDRYTPDGDDTIDPMEYRRSYR